MNTKDILSNLTGVSATGSYGDTPQPDISIVGVINDVDNEKNNDGDHGQGGQVEPKDENEKITENFIFHAQIENVYNMSNMLNTLKILKGKEINKVIICC